MNEEAQTWIALGIVAVTLIFIIRRILRQTGCGGGCDCGSAALKPPDDHQSPSPRPAIRESNHSPSRGQPSK